MVLFDLQKSEGRIPLAQYSQDKMQADAKVALALLKRFGAMDLHQALGLTPYLEGEK